jgi:hypothetical protein
LRTNDLKAERRPAERRHRAANPRLLDLARLLNAELSNLADADHLVCASLVQRPDLNDIPSIAMKVPGGGDGRLETVRRADAVAETVAKQNIPTRRNH